MGFCTSNVEFWPSLIVVTVGSEVLLSDVITVVFSDVALWDSEVNNAHFLPRHPVFYWYYWLDPIVLQNTLANSFKYPQTSWKGECNIMLGPNTHCIHLSDLIKGICNRYLHDITQFLRCLGIFETVCENFWGANWSVIAVE